jgi:hypothetical protein
MRAADNSAGAGYVHKLGRGDESRDRIVDLRWLRRGIVPQGILSERRPQAIRSVIRIIATALLTLDACSFVFLLQVQTKFFLAVNVFPS